MAKKVFKHLLQEIDRRAETAPIDPELPNRKALKLLAHSVDKEIIYHEYCRSLKIPNDSVANQTASRNRAYRAMLFDNVWDEELAGYCGITPDTLINYYSRLVHLSRMINNELEPEFREYVLSAGRTLLTKEENKVQMYLIRKKGSEKKSFLRQLLHDKTYEELHPPPRMLVQNRLNRLADEIFNLSTKDYDIERGYKNGDITRSEYKSMISENRQAIRLAVRNKRKAFRDIFSDKESNENFVFIRALSPSLEEKGIRNVINVASVSHGEDLLTVYFRWYNILHMTTIIAEKKFKKKSTDKSYKESRGAAQKRIDKQQRNEQIIQLHTEGLSGAEIGQRLGIAKSTVNDTIKKHKG
jgi:hypothetical protein